MIQGSASGLYSVSEMRSTSSSETPKKDSKLMDY